MLREATCLFPAMWQIRYPGSSCGNNQKCQWRYFHNAPKLAKKEETLRPRTRGSCGGVVPPPAQPTQPLLRVSGLTLHRLQCVQPSTPWGRWACPRAGHCSRGPHPQRQGEPLLMYSQPSAPLGRGGHLPHICLSRKQNPFVGSSVARQKP